MILINSDILKHIITLPSSFYQHKQLIPTTLTTDTKETSTKRRANKDGILRVTLKGRV